MVKDIIYYFYLKISDFFKKKKKNNRFYFQKVAVAFAFSLWCLAVINSVYGYSNNEEKEQIISAFSENINSTMTNGNLPAMSADISAYGKYGNINLSDNGKQIILENIAEKIGIYKYEITDELINENPAKVLYQHSDNGDVICRFVTRNLDEQYIFVDIRLGNSIESAFTYEKIVSEIFSQLGIDGNITVNLIGEVEGDISLEKRCELSDRLLAKINAKIIWENKTEDLFTIYAYDDDIKEYISFGNSKVNVNLAIRYDETRDVTKLYLSTPINNRDY